MEAGCKRLDEDQQARLSLALVACQMDQLGIRRKPVVVVAENEDDEAEDAASQRAVSRIIKE